MRKMIGLIIALAVILIGGTLLGAYYYDQLQNYITTDDAKVQGNLMTIGSLATGKLDSWNVKTGDQVKQGDVLGKVLAASSGAAGQTQTVDITAPVDGTIIESSAQVGQIVAPGIPLAISADMTHLYVTANILETNIQDVKVGQDVTINIDAISNTTFNGKVERIGLATTSTFSIMPSGNDRGKYTKIAQRIPVRISLDGYQGKQLVPGLNANIKIKK